MSNQRFSVQKINMELFSIFIIHNADSNMTSINMHKKQMSPLPTRKQRTSVLDLGDGRR